MILNVWGQQGGPRRGAGVIKEKHEIVFGEDLIPTDWDLIDWLFRAGVDMLVSTGIFNVDSEKVINVTEDEVMAVIRNAPKASSWAPTRTWSSLELPQGQLPEKTDHPGRTDGATVSEDIFVPMFQSLRRSRW